MLCSLLSADDIAVDRRAEKQRFDCALIQLSVQYVSEQSQLTLVVHRCTYVSSLLLIRPEYTQATFH